MYRVRHVPLVLLAFTLITVTAAADVDVASAPESLFIRFAVVEGAREAGGDPGRLAELQDELASDLEDWDLESDLEELARVFALEHLEEVSRWSSTVPARRGAVSTELANGVRIELESRLETDEIVVLRGEIYRDDEIVLAPTVRMEIGQRTVISSGSADGDFLFVFVEVSGVEG